MESIAQYGAVYCIENTVTHGVYIGMTTQDPKKRWRWHRCELRAGRHTNTHLQRSWNKHGSDSFEFVVIEEYKTLADVNEAERFWIETLRSCGALVYNSKSGGGFGGGLSYESRQKLSASHKGKVLSAETRRRVSEALTGKKKEYTPEAYARLRDRQWAIGRKHTDEHKRRISEASKGREVTEATRQKLRGRKHSAVTIDKIRQSQQGRTFTEETRQKMSLAHGRRNQYTLTDPFGVEYITHNLKAFCEEHNLSIHSMKDIARGRRNQVKGWTCQYQRIKPDD